MNSVSQGTVPPQRGRRQPPAPRPYRVFDLAGKPRKFGDLDAARRLAKAIADATGRPQDIKDTSQRGVWITVRPVQHRCPNSACRQPLTADEFDAAWPTFRCLHCGPEREAQP